VIGQVGGFFHQTLVALTLGRQDDLDGLLADLFDDLVLPGGEQPRGVGDSGEAPLRDWIVSNSSCSIIF
jgi:hypothetical protein